MTRAADRERWRRENLSKAFGTFIEKLSMARTSASDALHDSSIEELAGNIAVTEAYIPVEDCARFVSLYLPPQERKRFRGLTREFIALHSDRGLGDSRLLQMEKALEEIQQLFEKEL